MRRLLPPFLMCVLLAAPAFAQSAYVVGAVGVDIFRSDRVEAGGTRDLGAAGEAVAFSLRLGTAIGERWGVELALTRPDEIESDLQQGFPTPLVSGQFAFADVVSPGIVIPVFESRIRRERRNTTIDTVAWAAQAVGDRVALVYLGGLTFSRIVENVEFEFTRRAGAVGIVFPNSMRTITYGVGPVVGIDGRFELTDHVMLVPGVRLHSLRGNAAPGWLLRSSVGLGWTF